LTGGINTYAYAYLNPTSGYDPWGLTAWSEQQTYQVLQQAYASAIAGRVQGLWNIKNNSQGNGPYDFEWNADTINDTWTRCGKTMHADEFANYIAGSQGAAYDTENYWTTGMFFAETLVKGAGITYHVAGLTKAKHDPFERTGFPKINQGEQDAMSFKSHGSCSCAQ
jgi:hypothetical protein